ncbi:glycoside hydrolase family 15 protein [Halohasta litorea]|uniref:Glycoside hydrolase family 15 protein n=1 Tax=Halohasta litorea TaxID=869891 RepID=A0ABD6D822_9EURY|nr:glycoside hydrolase family 15 protein [Halohasta litorea]
MNPVSSEQQPTDFEPLEAYGVVGNLETVALIGRNGGIDWCCFPRVDSPSVFARLLDSERGGHLTIAPTGSFEAAQAYVDRTNVLQTRFSTAGGEATVTDFMPVPQRTAADDHRAIYRRVTGEAGSVDLSVGFEPRFDYARTVPTIEHTDYGVTAGSDGERLGLSGRCSFDVSRGAATANLRLDAGETRWIVLGYDRPVRIEPEAHGELLDAVVDYWREWTHSCTGSACPLEGPWHELAVRSELVLKLLIQRGVGTIAAAPTTSLPEAVDGSRNWDYRYNWIRDAAFTVQALAELGHLDEIEAYFEMCLTHCGQGTPAEMQPVYGLYGATDLTEHTLDHLAGYRGSTPVRVGNRAATQRQLDVYGELVVGVSEAVEYGVDLLSDHWPLIEGIADHVCTVWDEPDVGIWEIRGDPEQFVYSKVMCWAALDRAIAFVEDGDIESGGDLVASVDQWRETRETIRETVFRRGYNEELGSFVRSFEADDRLDAAVLRLPEVGFLPADDPRMEGTIDAIQRRLTTDEGLVHRLDGDDGLPGSEARFVVCTCWLVTALVDAGRIEEARRIFERLGAVASPLGLLTEEVDPETGRLLGNFPQAFSHIGVLTSALALTAHGGPANARSQSYPPFGLDDQPSTTYPRGTDSENTNH